ncbi:riboflavin biosynthesis protein [Siminovitchia terrae]|uniref:FAD synthase n=1 Tax=Siminovitchia terrae TaxID=1914933 RepID=A0A429X5M0_SIMTE|nr:FAD synthetase family protein [Siminovitchia terrae]RST58583.1 FAD synthetase family protein [Siminovitchia terrae]GIN96112.1 riboflavin biosynthesis protein [Siminovitchia terrae]
METIYIRGLLDMKTLTSEPCVMALGFFDGVHLGHRELIETSRKIAEQKNLTLTVMTFFPHPSNVLPNNQKIDRYLSPLDAKKEIFKELGVEKLFIVTFNQDFAKLAPPAFVRKYICGLNCKHVVAGFDFTYGFKGQGNMERIVQDGGGEFDITVVSKKSYKEMKISSTKIRELLNNGAVAAIPHYLGSYYSTYGQIENESYDLDNQTIMVNMSFDEYMLPRKGMYLIRLKMDSGVIEGICKLTESISGTQTIYIQSKKRPNLESRVKVEWILELEVLSPPETDEMVKKVQMVV